MFVKRNKNVEILPRTHSRTLVQVESTHFYRLQWWDRDSVVSNNKCGKRWKERSFHYSVILCSWFENMCKSMHMSKYLFTPLRSRGCPQRFARLSSSHSDLMLGVAKPCVLLHLCACKSNKHQMQTASKTLRHCYLGFLALLSKSTAICRVLSDLRAVDSLGKISIVW